ncbi:MAG: DUF1080 domain-containing protein [Planctomycetaceae bacterium]|jgi:hypothetical protein|nr:DUF1080 domain-containing protein [Planctomycetaceae bacterium]
MKKNQLQNQNKFNTIKNPQIKITLNQISIILIAGFFFLLNPLTNFSDELPNDDSKNLQWLNDKFDVSEPVSLIPQKNLDGWTAHYGKEPKGKWITKNGNLICLGTKSGLSGDLVSKKEYENFILDFEWINSKGGNSGIKYKLKDFGQIGGIINQNDKFTWLGCEYQILDDENNREGKNNKGKNSAASLYTVIAADKNKKLNPNGQPNAGRIIVANEHVEHWLNGEKVLEYNLNSNDWKSAYEKSKFARAENFAQNKSGFIMLQDHGNEITFTKLIIRELKSK